jgi:hypothetical protein
LPSNHGPAKWPKHVCRKAKRCDSKRNRDDENAHHDASKNVSDEKPKSRKDQPKHVKDGSHWLSLA